MGATAASSRELSARASVSTCPSAGPNPVRIRISKQPKEAPTYIRGRSSYYYFGIRNHAWYGFWALTP